jgi:prepilin-type N-terminal cleavage/methylation domain-containing protein
MNRRDAFRHLPVAKTRNGNGFSLIEILVVLVLLLIGILAILRLFPGGFLTIVRTAEMTAAQGLVDQQTNSYHNQISIPESLTAGLPDSNGDIIVIPGIRPDDLTDLSQLELQNVYSSQNISNPLANYSPYYFSNINKLRYVIGETFRLPISTASTIGTLGGMVYTLQNGPVFNIFHTATINLGGNSTTTDNADSIKAYGTDLTRSEQDSTTVTSSGLGGILTDGTIYAIDYANNQIAFFPRPANNTTLQISHGASYRQFRFRAAIYEPDPNNAGSFITQYTDFTVGVPDQTIANLTTPYQPMLPVWQPLNLVHADGTAAPNAHVWPETEEVSRQFRLVTQSTGPSPGFSDDPYEYAWYSDQIGTTNANLGTLIFNPKGHVYNPGIDLDPQPSVNDPSYLKHIDGSADKGVLSANSGLVARINYLTFDNHVIRDDRSVPSSFPYVIHLSLPYVSTTGDILADQATYNGLFTESSSTNTPDVIVYDMLTGQVVSQIGGTLPPGAVPATIDSKTGTLTLGDPAQNGQDVVNAGLPSANLRILYRTQKEYGMQVQQATSRYLPVPSPTTLDYRSFYIGGGTYGGKPSRIYFDVGQAGKTINVGEYFTGPTTNTNDRHVNATYQITENAADFESINGQLYAWVDFGASLNSTATGRAVNNVQGASLKSRVIWIGNTDVQTDPTNATAQIILKRWRKVDNDTVLQTTPQ